MLRRQLRDDDIACPAGRRVGDAGCYCALEEHVVDGRTETSSITGYCMSAEGHKECPTWRAEKQRLADSKDLRKSLIQKPDVRKGTAAQRQQRLQEAQAKLYSDSSEARRFRRRIGLGW